MSAYIAIQTALVFGAIDSDARVHLFRWGAGKGQQAGLIVHERDETGLLAAVRVYDDVEPPA